MVGLHGPGVHAPRAAGAGAVAPPPSLLLAAARLPAPRPRARAPPRRRAPALLPPPPAFYASGPLAAPAPPAGVADLAPDLFALLRPAGYLDVGSVPSGDTLQHTGDLVIHGSVAKGAAIVASGDVICLGSLQGSVHAGADLGAGANGAARVVALEMRGAQLKIADTQTLADAKVTVAGPHCAYVAASGTKSVIQVQPLGRTRPTPSIATIGASFWRWKRAYPAATASFVTGLYALLAGAALVAAPRTVLGLLFDVSQVPTGWIRVGGVLFSTFGLQYLGTAWGDWCRVADARRCHSAEVAGIERTMEREREELSQQARHRREQGAAGTAVGSTGSAGGGGRRGHEAGAEAEAAGAWGGPGSTSAASAEAERRRNNLLYSSTSFYSASVWSRLALAAAFVVLVVARVCEPGLLVLAAVNVYGAVSMAMALRRQWLLHTTGSSK